MLTQIVVWLNQGAKLIGSVLLAPIQWLPGWLSATFLSVISGLLMLVVFRFTSNQKAIRSIRSQIKANMLALTLFKDDIFVSLRCQTRICAGAIGLVLHSLIPMAVMVLPVTLLLGQASLWYQARPLKVGEEAVVTVQLRGNSKAVLDEIALKEDAAIAVVTGPVRIPKKNLVCWNLTPKETGEKLLQFEIDGQTYTKELSVGDGFKLTSLRRPPADWKQALLYPAETPFGEDSLVQSIDVILPARNSFTAGTGSWVVYWFAISMLSAFLAKPFLNVSI